MQILKSTRLYKEDHDVLSRVHKSSYVPIVRLIHNALVHYYQKEYADYRDDVRKQLNVAPVRQNETK